MRGVILSLPVLALLTCGCGLQTKTKIKEPEENAKRAPSEKNAWEKAGADKGWIQLTPFGNSLFNNEGKPTGLLAYQFIDHASGFDNLPPPEQRFGLVLLGDTVTDASLKGLNRYKNLEGLVHRFGHFLPKASLWTGR